MNATARRFAMGTEAIGLSPGNYRLEYTPQGKPPINGVVSVTSTDIKFTDGPWPELPMPRDRTKAIQVPLPLLLVPTINVADASARLVAQSDKRINADGTWLPSGEPHRVVIESPRHVRQTVRVKGLPGETVQLKVGESDMQLHPLWEKYQKTSTMRTVGWSLAGVGAASAIAAGVVGYFTSEAAERANTAFTAYSEATDLSAGREIESEFETAKSDYDGLLIGTIVTGVVAAGSLATAIYLLVEYPNNGPPGLRESNWQFTPWLAPGTAGASLQWGF
jgi:hypothetical protein